MTERPIIFSVEMVRAILEGRKTQTRRVVKTLLMPTAPGTDYCFHETKDGQWEIGYDYLDGTGQFLRYIKCPYGRPGDRLWVRETFGHGCADFRTTRNEIHYRADGIDHIGHRWQPSIHMPRWASRITLEIVKVRVERVQEITDSDIRDEGTENCQYALPPYCTHCGGHEHLCNRDRFCDLWNSINAKRGYSWESNPWVWVVEFKRAQ